MGSLFRGMESSMTTGSYREDFNGPLFHGPAALLLAPFSTENGKIKNLDFDHLSLDVWGIGPGFEETATTFSVCSWLFIYYVVCIVKTIFEIIS